MSEPRKLGPAGRFARAWISSKLTPLIITGAAADVASAAAATAKWTRAAEDAAGTTAAPGKTAVLGSLLNYLTGSGP